MKNLVVAKPHYKGDWEMETSRGLKEEKNGVGGEASDLPRYINSKFGLIRYMIHICLTFSMGS